MSSFDAVSETPNPAITYTVTDQTWNVQIPVTPPVYLLELVKQQLAILRAEGHENLVVTAYECLLEEQINERREGFPEAVEAERAWLAMDPVDQVSWCREQFLAAQLQTAAWADERGVEMRRAAS